MKFGDLVEARKVLKQFTKPKTDEQIFYELCFCICAPQTTFKNNIKVLDELKKVDYFNVDVETNFLERILKPVRFYRQKAKRLLEAKKNFSNILCVLKFYGTDGTAKNQRDWLVRNVEGLGMKTATHLLRNLGEAKDLAIIDTHILKYLKVKEKNWRYGDLERRLRQRAKRYGITVAELDAIVWKRYSNTDWKEFIH